MQQARGIKKPNQSKPQNISPFAKALAETDPGSSADSPSKTSLLSEALAQTGGKLPQEGSQKDQSDFLEKQEQEQLKAVEKERLKKELHAKINPVDQAEVFSAREKQVKEEIKELRRSIENEFKMLGKEISQLESEVGKTLQTEIAQPGTSGTYYINFFQRLRSFIMLLRQKVRSARTWANQMNRRKSKRRSRRGPGMVVNAAETKEVHDTLHHERSNAMGGG